MPGYATVAHVQRLEPMREINAGSDPSTQDVVGFLEETAAEIDGTLAAAGYKLPIAATAAQSLRLLQRLNAQGANALIQSAAAATRENAVRDSWDRYQTALRAIASGELALPDAATDASHLVA